MSPRGTVLAIPACGHPSEVLESTRSPPRELRSKLLASGCLRRLRVESMVVVVLLTVVVLVVSFLVIISTGTSSSVVVIDTVVVGQMVVTSLS